MFKLGDNNGWEAWAPKVTSSSSGQTCIAWNDRDVYTSHSRIRVVCSSNGGKTFGPIRTLSASLEAAAQDRVAIATSGTAWVVVWVYTGGNGGAFVPHRHALFSRGTHANAGPMSTQGSWSSPSQLNPFASQTGFDDFVSIAYGNGVFVAGMASQRKSGGSGSDYDVLIVWSTDDGDSWPSSQAVVVDDSVEDEHAIQIAISPDGTFASVVYHRINAGNHVYFSAASTSALGTWSTPVPLSSSGTADLNPSIAVGSDGSLLVTWQSSSAILWSLSNDGGTVWSSPQPSVALSRIPSVTIIDGMWLMYYASNNRLYALTSTDLGASWKSKPGTTDIPAKTSLTWPDGTFDEERDEHIFQTYNTQTGLWMATWVSSRPQGGGDWDIAFSVSANATDYFQ